MYGCRTPDIHTHAPPGLCCYDCSLRLRSSLTPERRTDTLSDGQVAFILGENCVCCGKGPDPGALGRTRLFLYLLIFPWGSEHVAGIGEGRNGVSSVGSGAPPLVRLLHCLCYLNTLLCKYADRKPVTQTLTQQLIEFHILRWAPV